jgi:hypothetical protein
VLNLYEREYSYCDTTSCSRNRNVVLSFQQIVFFLKSTVLIKKMFTVCIQIKVEFALFLHADPHYLSYVWIVYSDCRLRV